LLVLGGLLAALAWLSGQITITWAGVVLAAALGIIFAIPHSRRFVVRRFWCVLARHRFHRLCWEVPLHTRAGPLPVVLWTRPTRVGERLFIWCRAGLSAEDFTQYTGELAAACYAREARVTRNTRWSQLVTIDIIRRDTLAAKHQVGSPLARLSAVYANVLDGRPVLAGVTDDDNDSAPLPWPQQPAARAAPPARHRPRPAGRAGIPPAAAPREPPAPGTCPGLEGGHHHDRNHHPSGRRAGVPAVDIPAGSRRHRRVRRAGARRAGRT